MHKTISPYYTLFFLLIFTACQTSAPPPSEAASEFIGVEISEIEDELQTLIGLWYPRIVDTIKGGYFTNFEYDWSPSEKQPKMLVTQARGLWTAARMAQHFPKKKGLLEAADHGYLFLTTEMWDAENGGFFMDWIPSSERTSQPGFHLTYANAFALYALAEYAKINPDPGVLAWVEKVFNWLEEQAYDADKGGYFNLVFLDKTLEAQAQAGEANVGWGGGQWKGQNTSIHILEALMNVFQVLPTAEVKTRLAEMLQVVRDSFVRENGSLRLYYTNDWQPIDYSDSSRTFILAALGDDHVSFGHDIETAFLLLEAAEILEGGAADQKTEQVAKKMIDHTLAHGFDTDYQGLFDKGYYFKGASGIEVLDKKKTWWAQAEAWHALGLFAQHYPEEPLYAEAFQGMWRYLRTYQIDPIHGGWYNNGIDEDPESKTARKAHPWKSAYHNGRALVRVIEYTGVE